MGQRIAHDSMEARMEMIRNAVWSHFGSGGGFSDRVEVVDVGVIATFPDAVIAKNWTDETMMEIPYSIEEDVVTLGDPREVDNLYVTKSIIGANPEVSAKNVQDILDNWSDLPKGPVECAKALEGRPGVENPEALSAWLHYQASGGWPAEKAKTSAEITGPIVMKNAAKRIAYAAVLVPGEPDSDGETVDDARVEKAAHEWMENYRNVDLQHTLNNVGVPVESFLLPAEMSVKNIYTGEDMTLPKGTWILGSRTDEDTWSKVEKGELTGYSVMGIRRAATKGVDAALKKTLLRDLGEDWIAAAVSFVDEPAVPKAKFFALKSKGEQDEPEARAGLLERIFGSSSSAKEGRRFSKATLTKLKDMRELISSLLTEAEDDKKAKAEKGGDLEVDVTKEELQGMIDESVTKAQEATTEEITALKQEIVDLKAAPKDDDAGDTSTADEGDTSSDSEDGNEDGNEALKSQLREEILKELETEMGTKSRAIKGQDQGGSKDEPIEGYIERDIHGRRKRSL